MKINWNRPRKIILAAWIGAALSICGFPAAAGAGEALLGSPDFLPSAKEPIGWRGDWTGKYPGATPPVHWGRICKQIAALKCSSAIPTDQSPSNAVPAGCGFFREWLVAGPLSSAHLTNAITQELTPGEASLAPQEGDKIGAMAWRKVKVEDSFIDLFRPLGNEMPMNSNQAAYAQSCLFAEKPVKVWFQFQHAKGAALWLNGQLKFSHPDASSGGYPIQLDLQAGWNRFLFKLTPRVDSREDFPDTCYVRCCFTPVDDSRDYEEKNIAWIKPMPGLSQSMPIVVGDFIFTMAYPYNLVCLDKKSGKVLWIRPNSPYDAATGEDRKTKPELFAKLDEMAARRDAYYAAFVAGTMPTGAVMQEEVKLELEMDKLMVDVDQRYKRPVEQGEPDWWTIPTPASDGCNVYVFLTRGVSTAYDLKGSRKWIRYERPQPQHHGFFGSPVIADNKFVILDGTATALDLKDGSAKWSVDKITGGRLWFASLGRCAVDGVDYVLCPGYNVMIRASDGKAFGAGVDHCISTPVFQDGAIWQTVWNIIRFPVNTATNGGVTIGPAKSPNWKGGAQNYLGLNFYQGHGYGASSLIHDGLIYMVTYNGVLMVFDAASLEFVYRQELALDLFNYYGASVTMAGKYIYLMGSTGVTIVIKPGRKYNEVARNRIHCLAKEGRAMGSYGYKDYYKPRCIEFQDCTMTSTPIFDGNRMYFRGFENLYCVEQNVWALQDADVSRGEMPLPVRFDGSKSCAIPGRKLVKFTLDFGDGSTSSPQVGATISPKADSTLRQGSVQASSGLSAEHTYQAAGTYIAKLTVTDDKCISDEAETMITVMPVDTVPPVIKSVRSKGETNLIMRFSKPLEQDSAGNAENYAISQGVKIIGAALGPDLSEVSLTTTPLAENVKYKLSVRNVKDRARKPNAIVAASRQSFRRFRSPPDEEGYIRDWLMLPRVQLDTAGGKDVFSKEYFPGQKTLAPNEGDKVSVGGKELAWKATRSDDAVISLYVQGGNFVYFFVTYINCDEDIPDLRLRIGGSHDSSIWLLNGQEVARVYSGRCVARDLRVTDPVTLKKGRNVLSAQIFNSYGGRGMCARFVDNDDNPVLDYNVSTGAALSSQSAK